MSAPSGLDIEDRLLRLRKSYGATLHEKVDRLQRAARDFHPKDEKQTRISLEKARALAHAVAGSAATFGYAQVGQLARALEYRLEGFVNSRASIGRSAHHEIEELLQEILQEERRSQASTASQSTPARHHRVLIAQGRRWVGRELALAFERNGFEIQISDEYETTIAHAERFRPDVLIITIHPDEVVGFDLAERFWSNESFFRVEIFFFVKMEDFHQKTLLNGISDEWLLVPPFDSQELASRLLRRVFNIKVGRESSNRLHLASYLELFKRIAVAQGDSIIFAPLAPLGSTVPSSSVQEPPGLGRVLKRVLVVDDDKHLVEAICESLQDSGTELFKAYSGFQGVLLAARTIPDLIITDFEMPNGSAEYLISNLRQSASTRAIKVIVMTGLEVLERYSINQNPASYLKVVSYQPKPIDLESLREEVRRHLAAA